jgi:hypothetical protein
VCIPRITSEVKIAWLPEWRTAQNKIEFLRLLSVASLHVGSRGGPRIVAEGFPRWELEAKFHLKVMATA